MNIIKDRDFKIALALSSLILIHLAFSVVANISSYISLNKLVPNARLIDFGFVFFELVIFVISLIALYLAIKIAKMQKIGMKIGLGFIYSLITTYFVIYKFVIESFYHIQLGGGDWGYLVVILGWPVYFIVSIPLLIVFFKNFSATSILLSKLYFILMLLPTICGLILLTIVTFTGRLIYQPIYEQKKLQIQKNVDIKPIKIEYQESTYDPQCKCARPVVTGSIDISNSVNFPIVLEIKPSYEQGNCQIDSNFTYLLKKGTEPKIFHCFFNEFANLKVNNITSVTYTLRFEEKENTGVRTERTYSVNDFSEALNFQ